jgi:hypothetical protein
MTPASDVFSLGATLYTCIEGQPPFGVEDNALGMLHQVAGGQILPPRRSGSMTRPLLEILAVEPGERPTMLRVRDELATLAAGRDGDTTTVLLGRTDLKASGPARDRTAVFGAVGNESRGAAPVEPARAPAEPPARRTPPPAAPRPPAPPVATAPDGGDRRPRRRTGLLWVAVGALAMVLAGLIAFWAIDPPGVGTSDGAQSSSSAVESSAGATSAATAESAAQSTADSAETTPETTPAPPAQEPADTGVLTADNVREFLREYHRLVLEDPEEAYALTGPTLRAAISEDNYAEYWAQFSDVKVSDVEAADGESAATATVEFRYEDGTRQKETHRFTFLVDGDQLILDSDYKA